MRTEQRDPMPLRLPSIRPVLVRIAVPAAVLAVALAAGSCGAPSPTPNPSAIVPVSFPINFSMITDKQNHLVWATASFTTKPDGSQTAEFVPVDAGASTNTASNAITAAAALFNQTSPITGGYSFNDGFGQGSITSAGNGIVVTYTPGAAPSVPMPADWPTYLVPVPAGTGSIWRMTWVSRQPNGAMAATFVPDRALTDADLAAIATASTRALSPQTAPDGGIAFRTPDNRLGSWTTKRGGFVVTITKPVDG